MARPLLSGLSANRHPFFGTEAAGWLLAVSSRSNHVAPRIAGERKRTSATLKVLHTSDCVDVLIEIPVRLNLFFLLPGHPCLESSELRALLGGVELPDRKLGLLLQDRRRTQSNRVSRDA